MSITWVSAGKTARGTQPGDDYTVALVSAIFKQAIKDVQGSSAAHVTYKTAWAFLRSQQGEWRDHRLMLLGMIPSEHPPERLDIAVQKSLDKSRIPRVYVDGTD